MRDILTRLSRLEKKIAKKKNPESPKKQVHPWIQFVIESSKALEELEEKKANNREGEEESYE